MALWTRGRDGHDPAGVVHHSDSEYVGAGVPGLPDPHSGDFQAAWHKAKGYENDPVEVARREWRKDRRP
jgi:hypothetical protein